MISVSDMAFVQLKTFYQLYIIQLWPFTSYKYL